MTAVLDRPAPASRPARRRRSPLGWLREHLIAIIAGFAFLYLLLPNAVVVLFSFNDPEGRFNLTWQKFSLDAWLDPCGAPGLCESLALSLKIGIASTLAATALGTLAAFAMARHRFRGRSSANLLVFLPMATPEVVMGASLLAMFVSLGFDSVLGFVTIVIAHVMFCLSFVVVTVKARLIGLDQRLEQAAMDLYANEWQTFRLVTLPLALPGIIAAAMLAFSLSFDDFIVTNFTSGQSVTFPLYVYGAKLKDFPPQLFVVGTIMFFVSFVFVVGGELWRRRRNSF